MAIFKKKTQAPTHNVVPSEKQAEKPVKAKKAKAVSVLALRTILRPFATEKTARLADKGVYAFIVARDANRVAVGKAVRELYGVTPVKVNIMNVRGTARRFGRAIGRTSDMRKALVTLPQGTRIDVFESV